MLHVRAYTGLSGGDLLYFTEEDFELFGIDATYREKILENLRITLLERGVVVDDEIALAQTLTVCVINCNLLKQSFGCPHLSAKLSRLVLLGLA